jgi:hypothetical protein
MTVPNGRNLTIAGGTYSQDVARNSIFLSNGQDAIFSGEDWSALNNFTITGWLMTTDTFTTLYFLVNTGLH